MGAENLHTVQTALSSLGAGVKLSFILQRKQNEKAERNSILKALHLRRNKKKRETINLNLAPGALTPKLIHRLSEFTQSSCINVLAKLFTLFVYIL